MFPDESAISTATILRAREFAFQRWRIRVAHGPEAGLERDIVTPEFSIGSAEGNDLVLADPAVSRHHCLVCADPLGLKLSDLSSKNGTYLGEYRVQTAYLKEGASVTVGSSSLTFHALPDKLSEPLADEERFGRMLGTSAAIRRIFFALPKIAASKLTVLLEGETGTGKGLIAEAIHQASPRASGPFVVLDCSAIPPTLIESELFGHAKGAFTGAHGARPGAFEAASGGTVFLDEIGELPLAMQPKLLRALEEGSVRRLGSVEPVELDVRVIAATNRNLRQEVNRGAFRSDLFYRLNVVRICIPPLRERPQDIPLLVAHFYEQVAAGPSREPPAELINVLSMQDWPGNVRELRSAVERAVLMEDPELWRFLSGKDAGTETTAPAAFETGPSFRAAKERAVAVWERDFISRLLGACAGNLSAAARAARMDRNYLRELVVKHSLISKEG